jgi:uncharacterized membrane protein
MFNNCIFFFIEFFYIVVLFVFFWSRKMGSLECNSHWS